MPNPLPAQRVTAFGRYGVYSPYETHEYPVNWTVQRFEEGDEECDLGEIIGEFPERHWAELFAEAAFESDDAARMDKIRDKCDPD